MLLALGVAALLALAAPAWAAAETFSVNTVADSGESVTPCNGVQCSLREAIELANENPGADTITFIGLGGGAHELLIESPLPEITDGVRIEGPTPEGPGGLAIALVPITAAARQAPGLSVNGGTGTRIQDLVIGGFSVGIEVGPEDSGSAAETEICGDYLGSDLSGENAKPNEIGIAIRPGVLESEKPADTTIGGVGCGENVIVANTLEGIFDGGLRTHIAGNSIGLGVGGQRLSNGTPGNPESGGIFESAEAVEGTIGGPAPGGSEQNLIWENDGSGVFVESTASEISIRGNSSLENEGPGIDIPDGEQPAPTLASASSPEQGKLDVEGTVTGTVPGEMVELEFFGVHSCGSDPEGQVPLGTFSMAVGAGSNPYSTQLTANVPAGLAGITVTSTRAAGATTEFSNCANYAGAERTFTVESLGDAPSQAGCEADEATCTLRGAIEAANATEARDTIDFGLTGTIEPTTELPEIGEPVMIDGTSAPGYAAKPLVEIKGSDPNAYGLILTTVADGSTVSGLAFGGFKIGVVLNGDDQRVCGSYLGVGLDGTTTVPNHVGVSIEQGTTGDEVGAGCEGVGDGNLISGNTFGIIDFGSQTLIAANRIGIDASGAELPNGDPGVEGAGIAVEGIGTAAIGPAGLEGANTIAHNAGPGILVERPSSKAAIRGNSIFENELQGIETANEASSPPTLTNVEVGADSLLIEGEVTATGDETIGLDFFASPACSVPGGQTYLGESSVSGVGGPNDFDAELTGELPPGEEYITATMTGSVGGQTTEFSECFHYQAPTPPPGEQTFIVNRLEDTSTPALCEEHEECTLRGAIEAANATPEADTIDFAAGAEGRIEIGAELPHITEPVTIDGTTAPGYVDRPVVLLDGSEAAGEGGSFEGLVVTETGGGSVIQGLALGGFRYAVRLDGTVGSQICASWVGVELDGHTALPNEYGIESGSGSSGNEIGAGCGGGGGNSVVANSVDGIVIFGSHTAIGGNRIGVGPDGMAMGNGGAPKEETAPAGILVKVSAEEPTIGGIGALPEEPAANTIAYNEGPGVLIERATSQVAIRGNSIYGNVGEGIKFFNEEHVPVPTIAAVEPGGGGITVEGAVSTGEEEPIQLDFFASAVCGPLSEEGESFLGEGEIAESNPTTPNAFTATVAAPASDDQTFITVTATGAFGHRTTEFSECFKYVPPEPEREPEPEAEPEHHEESKPPTQNSVVNPSPPGPTPSEPEPTNGEKVVVKPEEGKVKIKLPGTDKSVPLEELKEIPVGAVIDASKGRVTLTSVDPDGKEQTAEFYGGVFKVKQVEGSNLVVLELFDTNVCPAPKPGKKRKGNAPRAFASSVSAHAGTHAGGALWGSGHGNFRTEGHDGSATVRGTTWLVEDRCNGTTFFKTRRGIVSVHDFVAHKTLPLPAGKTYVAGE